MGATCHRCDTCHDTRCAPLGVHDLDCVGLLVYVLIDGVVYCVECDRELSSGATALRVWPRCGERLVEH
jgi:hypothetical protein